MRDRSGGSSDSAGAGRSVGGWSDAAEASTVPPPSGGDDEVRPHPFSIEASGRYRELEMVGRGGMGQVVVARDRRLGRDVALKRIAAPDDAPGLAARLAREARLTAVLEHPSIVPVYDAGVAADGRLYYTMRLIHGRSLAEAAAACQRPHERLRLLRPFLAVCEAVGYAHSRGVVHRDLKPANVMVGSFGETQVVDWGLAAITASAPAALRDEPVAIGDTDAAIGTPGYMSPEQAAGSPADPRADVWSLGVILHELVTGERTGADGAPTPALRRAARTDRTPPPGRAAALPPELAAIVAKATAATPARRYPDAGAMAAEVARFLDGRRVEAHTYSTIELAGRLVRRLRLPLALAATALTVTSVAVTLSFRRIEREQHETRLALARAHTRQAIGELENGAVAEAGVLAAHALAYRDDPDARGVVAAALASPHPRHAETIALPGCDHVVPGSWELALCRHDSAIELWQLQPTRRRWRAELTARVVALARPRVGPARVIAVDGEANLLVLDARDGSLVRKQALAVAVGFADLLELAQDGARIAVSDGRLVNVVELATGAAQADRPCLPRPVLAIAGTPTGFVAVCGDGSTRVTVDGGDAGGWRPGPSIPGASELGMFAAAVSPDGRSLAIGGLAGRVVQLDLATGAAQAPIELGAAVVRLAYLPGTMPRLLVGTEQRGAAVLDVTAGAEVLRLPDASSREFRALPDGVIAGGSQAGRWQLDEQLRPRALRAPAGLSSVATTADRRWIAAARGDGQVSVWDGRTGALATELAITRGVVKAVAFSPDGDRLAISQGGPGDSPTIRDVGDWQPHELAGEREPARRLAYDADGTLVAARFTEPPLAYDADGRHSLGGPEIIDLATTPDRARVVLLGKDGWVFALGDGDALVPLVHAPGADTVAAWAGGARLATAQGGTIRLHDPLGGDRRLETTARIFDLAVSPDERYLLAATSDGTVEVWRLADGRRVATLRGHHQRVVHLAFSADGVALAAGWDGAVLSWDLRALDASPAALVSELEARWGTDLPLTLAASRP